MFKVNHKDSRILVSLLLTLNVFTPSSSVAIVHHEHINVYPRVLSCVNIITQSIKISKCFISHHSK